jgi:hypothetical protein
VRAALGAAWRLVEDGERTWLDVRARFRRTLELRRLLVDPGGEGEDSVVVGVGEVRDSVRAHAGRVAQVLYLLLGAAGTGR